MGSIRVTVIAVGLYGRKLMDSERRLAPLVLERKRVKPLVHIPFMPEQVHWLVLFVNMHLLQL